MGMVFEAYDQKLDRKVAIKQMRPELKSDRRGWEQFVQEAKIVSHLSHPYIVGIHEMVEHGADTFLVFDYVDGKPLSAILAEKKRLPLDETKRIMSLVCEAIGFAHGKKVLHRDLKPANIMLDGEGYAKVMDFGIAREAKNTISRFTHTDSSGTPVYMAPEQHLGKAVQASDIFSLGVCLYEMMTGRLPYEGSDLLAQKERRAYPPPRQVAPDLPANADILIAAALEPDPAKRIADAAELAQLLKDLK